MKGYSSEPRDVIKHGGQPPAGRSMQHYPSEPSEEVSPADALASDLWPPEQRENTLLLFGHATWLVGS